MAFEQQKDVYERVRSLLVSRLHKITVSVSKRCGNCAQFTFTRPGYSSYSAYLSFEECSEWANVGVAHKIVDEILWKVRIIPVEKTCCPFCGSTNGIHPASCYAKVEKTCCQFCGSTNGIHPASCYAKFPEVKVSNKCCHGSYPGCCPQRGCPSNACCESKAKLYDELRIVKNGISELRALLSSNVAKSEENAKKYLHELIAAQDEARRLRAIIAESVCVVCRGAKNNPTCKNKGREAHLICLVVDPICEAYRTIMEAAGIETPNQDMTWNIFYGHINNYREVAGGAIVHKFRDSHGDVIGLRPYSRDGLRKNTGVYLQHEIPQRLDAVMIPPRDIIEIA